MPRGRLSVRFAYRDPKGKPDRPDRPDRPSKPDKPIEPGQGHTLVASAGFYFTQIAGAVSEEI